MWNTSLYLGETKSNYSEVKHFFNVTGIFITRYTDLFMCLKQYATLNISYACNTAATDTSIFVIAAEYSWFRDRSSCLLHTLR